MQTDKDVRKFQGPLTGGVLTGVQEQSGEEQHCGQSSHSYAVADQAVELVERLLTGFASCGGDPATLKPLCLCILKQPEIFACSY